MRDTISTLEDQRQALLLLKSYFSFKGQSETWLSFSILKELKELEKINTVLSKKQKQLVKLAHAKKEVKKDYTSLAD